MEGNQGIFPAVISAADVVRSVLPVYLLILAGAICRKSGVLRREGDEGIMKLIYNIMLPCLILDKVLGSAVLKSGAAVVWAIGVGFVLVVSGMAIGLMVGKLLGMGKGTGMRTFAITSGVQNFGFVAAPVIEALWGGAALGVMFVHNIGIEIAMWSIGLMIMSGESGLSWRKLLNGPLFAVTLGLLLVASGLDVHIDGPFRKAMSMIGVGAFPIAVFITGCSMMDLLVSERPSWKVIVGSTAVRLALAPALILVAAKFLPLATELKQVLIVQAAMPAGMTAILMARLYGGKPVVAVQIVIATTIFSLFTLPWIVIWGCRWIGLTPLLR